MNLEMNFFDPSAFSIREAEMFRRHDTGIVPRFRKEEMDGGATNSQRGNTGIRGDIRSPVTVVTQWNNGTENPGTPMTVELKAHFPTIDTNFDDIAIIQEQQI